ncbi:MAG: site-2 protease family protein [Patescibacteria group bacterium]
MSATDTIFYIIILIMSVVVHEVSHGFMAERFGDKTARFAGRLTLNPLKHLDMFGSIILPGLLIITHAPFLFGWAKPVPYNPNNLTDKRWGEFWVAAAGILANFFIAVIFGLIIRFSASFALPDSFYTITSTIVITNLVLALFNLVPIPPLDGSKILFTFLPRSFYGTMAALERYSFILLILFVVYFSNILFPIMAFLFHLIAGIAI